MASIGQDIISSLSDSYVAYRLKGTAAGKYIGQSVLLGGAYGNVRRSREGCTIAKQ